MPRKKRTYTKSDITLIWNTLKAQGEEPLYVKHTSDGGFRVVTRAYVEATNKVPANDDDPTLTGWDDVVADGKA